MGVVDVLTASDSDIDDLIDPIIGFTIGGRYLFTPALSVGVDASREKFDKSTLDATESVVAVGVRYQFGAGK